MIRQHHRARCHRRRPGAAVRAPAAVALLRPATEPAPRRTARYARALPLARIYDVFPLLCPQCAAEARIIAVIIDLPTLYDILAHRGVPTAPSRIAPARDPIPPASPPSGRVKTCHAVHDDASDRWISCSPTGYAIQSARTRSRMSGASGRSRSIDDAIGAYENRQWNLKSRLRCGIEVKRQFEPFGLFDGQISSLCALCQSVQTAYRPTNASDPSRMGTTEAGHSCRVSSLPPPGGPARPGAARALIGNLRSQPVTRRSRRTGCATPALREHLVGAKQDRLWDREPKIPGGLHVCKELEPGGALDRQHRWALALENPVDVGCGAPV